MKRLLYFAICLSLLTPCVYSHSADDPVKNMHKNKSRLAVKQKEFPQLKNSVERLESLNKQVGYLQQNILILRNLMAKDYPHVNESMSKYKLDYIKEVEKSLKAFKKTIKLMESTISD